MNMKLQAIRCQYRAYTVGIRCQNELHNDNRIEDDYVG